MTSADYLPTHDSGRPTGDHSGALGGQSSSRVMLGSCASVRGLLIGGGTPLTENRDPPLCGSSDVDPRLPVKLLSSGSNAGSDRVIESCWNPRASMAYDSAKGLLNPVGENNCFLNSAVQVRLISLRLISVTNFYC